MASCDGNSGGYEYEFVNTPPDWLICKICQCPSKKPHLSACCGHTFCKSCLEAAKKATAISNACPMCRSEEFSTIPNKQADRLVRSLHVYCTNKEKGCKWRGEVNDIISHLGNSEGCQFREMCCPNDCGKSLQRQYLTIHVETECPRRKVKCQYCQDTGEYQFIEGQHKKMCLKFPLPCPNKCEANSIPREDIDEHRKKCPLEEVNCPNGCGTHLQRQYLNHHAENSCRCRIVQCQHCRISGQHEFIEDEHKDECSKFPLPCPNSCEVGCVLREELQEHIQVCPLEIVLCDYHTVGCGTRMARKDRSKHNQEMMEQHLSFTLQQLMSTQQNLVATQVEGANMKQQLALAHQQIGVLSEKLEHFENKTGQALSTATTTLRKELKQNIEKKVVATTQELDTTKQELTTISETLKSAQLETKEIKKDFTEPKKNLLAIQNEAKKKNDETKRLNLLKENLLAQLHRAQETYDKITEEFEPVCATLQSAEDRLYDELNQVTRSKSSIDRRFRLNRQSGMSGFFLQQERARIDKSLLDLKEKYSSAQNELAAKRECFRKEQLKAKKTLDELTQQITSTDEKIKASIAPHCCVCAAMYH